MAAISPSDPEASPSGARRPGVALEWRDLAYVVPLKGAKAGEPTTKRVLSKISGRAEPGTLTLLMGPSGAGKTSLLRLLSRRVSPTSGDILINGETPTVTHQRVQGFVEQEVVHFEMLTVREILRTTARLKLPESVRGAELDSRVDDVIAALDIGKCADTRVGGCSGGEKRRLAVAAELLGQPSLLFLDEPTTGLDAYAAMSVVRILRRLAHEQHRTIICTIHQPRASLLPLADQLVLLADGRQVYTGPTFTMGMSDGMLAYFEGLGFPCSAVENPGDHIVDIVNTRDSDGDVLGDTGTESPAGVADPASVEATDSQDSPSGGVDSGAIAATAEAGKGGESQPEETDGDAGTAPAAAEGGAVVEVDEAGKADAEGADAEGPEDEEADAEEEVLLSRLPKTTGWQDGSEAAEMALLKPEERAERAASVRQSRSREAFVAWMAEQFEASEIRGVATRPLTKGEMPATPAALSEKGSERPSRYPTSCWTQTCVVFRRTWLFKLREPEAAATQALNLILVSAIIASVYAGLPASFKGVQDRFGFVSLFFLFAAFAPIDLLTLFPKERAVFKRDSDNNLYGSLAFFWGRSLAELPAHIIFMAIGATIAYWIVGFQSDAAKFGIFLLNAILMLLTGAALMGLCSSLARTLAEANGVGTIALMMAVIFNGFFIAAENTPVVFRWISDISFLRFGLQVAMTNEFAGLEVTCTPQEVALGCLTSGDEVLRSRGLPTTTASIWEAMGWVALQNVIMRLLTFFALHFLYTGKPMASRFRALCEW